MLQNIRILDQRKEESIKLRFEFINMSIASHRIAA